MISSEVIQTTTRGPTGKADSAPADVLVLGAGPVGLTLASELLRHGVKPRIVDKASGIREVSKAMILHVRTQEALDKIGVAERVRGEGQALREVVVNAYGKHIGSWDLDHIDSPYAHPIILGQNRTQHALLDRLNAQGGQVEWGVEATGFALEDSAAAATLRHADGREEHARARFVIGAEGSNSIVRRTIGMSFEGDRYSGEQFIQADCRIRWSLPKGRSYLFLTADGYMMVIEFPDDVVRIFISLPDAGAAAAATGAQTATPQMGAVEATNEEPTLGEIAHHLTRLTGLACELTEPIWLARYRTSHRYADRFRERAAFIAGDAGHVHVPIGGQGMNTGIQDAFNLAWKLAGVVKGELAPSVLDSYNAERHPVAKALISGTNTAYTGILHPSELKQRAARLIGPWLINNDRVRGFMRDTLEELRIFYPDSPLNLDLGGAHGSKPGERVLDATVVRFDDKATVSINEITRAPLWTLLLFGGASHPPENGALVELRTHVSAAFGPRIQTFLVVVATGVEATQSTNVLLDPLQEAHTRYGVTAPAFYLLRPDTYVCARGPVEDGEQLIAHLRTIFA